jgi:hypoxanthine phosphoribosyltransferase
MVEFFYFLLGVLATILLSPWFKESIARIRKRPSWKTFFNCLTSDRVIKHITDPDKRPDIIIGLNNGIVAGSILATNLGVEDIYYYHAFPTFDDNGHRKEPHFRELPVDLTNKRVLIIDDQYYSGYTMKCLYDHILKMKGADPKNIDRYAVFRFDSPVNRGKLEIEPCGTLTGAIKGVPWSFTRDHMNMTTHVT